MPEKLSDIEEQRKQNAIEMDKRCIETTKYLKTTYPMKPDNPLLNASDDEIRAYIRKRREIFMAPGGPWEKYQEEMRKETANTALGQSK